MPDFESLPLQVQTLRHDASQLVGMQPAATKIVRNKEREVVDSWTGLKSRVHPHVHSILLSLMCKIQLLL